MSKNTTDQATTPDSLADAGRERHEYPKKLRWWDGVAISLSIPAALFISLGYAIGAIGAIPAMILSGAAAIFAAMQNNIYAEMASMFPKRTGGIAMFAHEGWKNKFVFMGPIAAFGYWFAWASALSIYGLQIGELIQAQWFPDQAWYFTFGAVNVGLAHFIAIGVIAVSWALNVLGMRPAMWIIYLTGFLVLIPIVVFAAAPLLSSAWSADNLTSDWSGGGFPVWQAVVAWALVQAWAVYGIEAVATFTPEFKDSVKDSRKALRIAGIFVIVAYFLVPYGVGGLVGQPEVAENPVAFYVGAFESVLGGAGPFMTLCIIAGLVLLVVMTTADGGRVLHGSAESGLTIKQLGKMNRFGMPSRAMSLDLILNVILILFVGSVLAVLVAGIIGIIVAHILALSAYVMLRRRKVFPNRGTKLSPIWTAIGGIICVINLIVLVLGSLNAEVTGYGTIRELLLGLSILAISVLLYIYRRVVQDKKKLVMRDPVPVDPEHPDR